MRFGPIKRIRVNLDGTTELTVVFDSGMAVVVGADDLEQAVIEAINKLYDRKIGITSCRHKKRCHQHRAMARVDGKEYKVDGATEIHAMLNAAMMAAEAVLEKEAVGAA